MARFDGTTSTLGLMVLGAQALQVIKWLAYLSPAV